MEASRVGCDGQLVDLRFVPCEVRPENVFHFLDEWRLVEAKIPDCGWRYLRR